MLKKSKRTPWSLFVSILTVVGILLQTVLPLKEVYAIVPYSAEFYSFGKPEDPIRLVGDITELNRLFKKARDEGKLYISSLNTVFHTYKVGNVRKGEFLGWDGKLVKETITDTSKHKVKFVIPVPRNTTILGTTAIFESDGRRIPPTDILVPEKWVSYPEEGLSLEWITEKYSNNQGYLFSEGGTPGAKPAAFLTLIQSGDKTGSPGYYLDGDTIVFNAYMQFRNFGTGLGEEGSDNITEELQDLRDMYIKVEDLKKAGAPSYEAKKAEIEALIADYHQKVGDDAFRIHEPFIRTGKMAGNSRVEEQFTYYTNPGVYFTPNEDCDAYVHKYYYVKQGETETLENYIWQPYKKEQGYTVKNEGAYEVVAYHTITDETACKPEPNLPNYETTVPLFNGSAKGTGPGVLPKEKTLQPAPKGSEIAIKLLREEEVPQEPPKDTVLELTQKRISRRFDLSPWKKDGEDKPLTLTYTWPSVPPCVCEQCDADSPCVNFCFSTVEPSMTFIVKQINTLNRQLVADGEYFKAYEEDNTAQVARGDKAGKHDIKPNYHFVIYHYYL